MSAPDWQPAVVDGQPDVVMNAAAVAEMVRESPLGRSEALARLRVSMSPAHFAAVERELA